MYEECLLSDEIHFIFSCQLFNSLRSKFFADVNERYPIFDDLEIIFLFNNIDPFQELPCPFIQLFQKRLLLRSVMRDAWFMFHSPRRTMVDCYCEREFQVGNK